jgi:dTDP-3-amino-2,3,6-trideoxy-4-keto-D-glucose/dTDP-3-amino-3,4,6-trideoxy-alpha-D-glucose/dTDP-2,6-dideoxy-D-kanosamine transaminase
MTQRMLLQTRPLLINDLARHNAPLLPEIESAIQAVLRSGWYILGAQVARFEESFAAFCGVAHSVGVGNGTDALELGLRALGIGPGDEVVTVANAGGYGTTAIRCTGAYPVYVDIHPQSMLMNADDLRNRITSRTRAIIATHLYGRMVDMPALKALADAAGIPVIEDSAQAHGARLQGKAAGSWGQLGCFSFYPTKNLGALGDGGAITTNDAALAERLRALRQYGWTPKYQCATEHGRNSRLDEIQAAILSVKLKYLDSWNCRRRTIGALYSELLAGADVRVPPPPDESDAAHLFVVRAPERDRIRTALAGQGIGAEVHYPIPDHRQMCDTNAPWSACDLPVTETCCREVLTLPCFPEMRDEEVAWVAEAVRKVT